MFAFFEYLNHLFHEYMSGVHTKDIPVIVDALFGPTMGQTFEARTLSLYYFVPSTSNELSIQLYPCPNTPSNKPIIYTFDHNVLNRQCSMPYILFYPFVCFSGQLLIFNQIKRTCRR
jgi:hypothetical protein